MWVVILYHSVVRGHLDLIGFGEKTTKVWGTTVNTNISLIVALGTTQNQSLIN